MDEEEKKYEMNYHCENCTENFVVAIAFGDKAIPNKLCPHCGSRESVVMGFHKNRLD